ncbi:MAG: hypothetical protein IT497_08460, partial [Ottowia sp.]|nr:hypothetical protein [Ottowia sp.]
HVFKVPNLARLHFYWQQQKIQRQQSAELTRRDNLLLRKLMQDLPDDDAFYQIYNAFVKEVVGKAFQPRLSYSMHPKMRVHLAGTPSVSGFHCDVDITQRPDQINVWLPFTDTYEGNTLWVESDYGNRDYHAIPVRYGQALIFDGGFLSHGTVANATTHTRVSIDFRFALKEKGNALSGVRDLHSLFLQKRM